MIVADFSYSDFRQCLKQEGIVLQLGPFSARIKTAIPSVAGGLHLLYSQYPVIDQGFVDFHVSVTRPSGVRRWFRPQVDFFFDGVSPFKPLPYDQAFAMLEWGLNWCISAHSHQYLIIHAAVVEKNGVAILLPAPPGSGKSTLCAGLVSRGWRLFSDELALMSTERVGEMIPVPRPISLKNASIEVMKSFAPDGVYGSIAHDTAKGSVSHLGAPGDSVHRSGEIALAGYIIFPTYQAHASSTLIPRLKTHAFMEIARQSFNYNILGEAGFNLLTDLISNCECCNFTYSDLDDAIRIFDALVSEKKES